MALQEGSPEDIREVRLHLDAENSIDTVYNYNSYGDITQAISYDGTEIYRQINIYYAGYKVLNSMTTLGNIAESGDGTLSIVSGFPVPTGSNFLRNTYTYSSGISNVYDIITNHGNLTSYFGSSFNQGFVSVLLRFSDFTNVTSVELRIGSSTVDYKSKTLYSGIDYTANNQWFPLEFDISTATTVGSPDVTAVDYWALIFTISSGTSKTIDIKSLMAYRESTTSFGDSYEIHRQTETWTSESKTYEYKMFYSADGTSPSDFNVVARIVSGAY